jgi:HPt (histidine-containing phosphotransfer) domain-containing protein
MKGTGATLGARALSERCAELERLTRAGSLPDVVARTAAIEACYVAVDRALRTEVGDAGA